MANDKLEQIYTTTRGKALLDAISGFNVEFTKSELVELALEQFSDELIVQLVNRKHGEFKKRTLKPGRKKSVNTINIDNTKNSEKEVEKVENTKVNEVKVLEKSQIEDEVIQQEEEIIKEEIIEEDEVIEEEIIEEDEVIEEDEKDIEKSERQRKLEELASYYE